MNQNSSATNASSAGRFEALGNAWTCSKTVTFGGGSGFASSTLRAVYEYDPYGNPIRQENVISTDYAGANPFRFSTKFTDNETGLLYYGFRYYQPSTGRWLSRDPIGEDGGVNLYGFVGNEGVNNIDKLGQRIYSAAPESLREPVKLALEKLTDSKLCWQKVEGSDTSWVLKVMKKGTDKLWDDLAPALGLENRVIIVRVEDTKNATAYRGTGIVEINENVNVDVPEIDGSPSGFFKSPPKVTFRRQPFEAVLWHELVGHIIKNYSHPKDNWNRYDEGFESSRHFQWGQKGDPTIYVENQARKKLNVSPRAIWYWDYNRTSEAK